MLTLEWVVAHTPSMPRHHRASNADYVYHVLNRGNDRAVIFQKPADYEAFESLLAEARVRVPIRLLSYCLMPNHWHLVLWPREDGQMPRFMEWLTGTHAQRWRIHRKTVGNGHVYQDRYKSFPVQDNNHFFVVCRYVERNALRANLVRRAEEWRWGSLWRRAHGADKDFLDAWPTQRPKEWLEWVNRPQTREELAALRTCVQRNRPYGDPRWQERAAAKLGLESTLRSRGRQPRGSAAQ